MAQARVDEACFSAVLVSGVFITFLCQIPQVIHVFIS